MICMFFIRSILYRLYILYFKIFYLIDFDCKDLFILDYSYVEITTTLNNKYKIFNTIDTIVSMYILKNMLFFPNLNIY